MCRSAKVRCNGQQECDRCASKGLYCRYTSNTTPASLANADQPRRGSNHGARRASAGPWGPPAQTQIRAAAPEDMAMDLSLDGADQYGLDGITGVSHTAGDAIDWSALEVPPIGVSPP